MDTKAMSNAFQTFLNDAPQHAKVWMEMVHGLHETSHLDPKTEAMAYIAVLAATGLESGIPFHVKQAKSLGATRQEIISAILVGLPAAGNTVVKSLPAALHAYDE